MRVSRERVKIGFKFLAGAICDRYPCHIVFTGVRPHVKRQSSRTQG